MEPRADMLPDASLTSQVVIEDPKIEKPVEPVVDAQAKPAVPQESPKGDQTPDNKLYAALQEERRKVRELREQIEASVNVPSEDLSDEGKALRKEIDALKDEIELGKVLNKYPGLTENLEEFNEFRSEYPRHKLDNVARLFLIDKGLIEPAPNRIGLERPTGGPKTGQEKKYTGEQISDMMKNDNRRFQRLVREGKIRAEDIESVA